MNEKPSLGEKRSDAVTAPPRYKEQDIDSMETFDLLVLYKETGHQELKWPLVLRYEWLVRSIALQIFGVYSSFAQLDDIINEGVITLMSAVDKFELDKGIKFETYVSKRIRGMIIDLARRQDWLPRSVRKRSREIDQTVTALYYSLGRYPTDFEICRHLGISIMKYREDLVNIDLCNVMSLESLFENRDLMNSGIPIPSGDTSMQPDQSLQDAEFREKLVEGVRSLRENEQLVLSLYYQKDLNMREIAAIMQISEPRISQIHSKAIQKLRHYLEQYLKS